MARFLTRHAKCELRPRTPVTFPDPVKSNHGPDNEPVGFGVAISNILLRSSLSDLHSCDVGVAEMQWKKNNCESDYLYQVMLLLAFSLT